MQHTSRQTNVGEHAVVLGGSFAGLVGAASLTERFDRVTIVERDGLPSIGKQRNGVLQGRHVHILLPSGLSGLANLFPGIEDELGSHGAHIIDAPEFRFYLGGGRLGFGDHDLRICGATRPLLEGLVRQRLRALPNVRFIDRCVVKGLVADSGQQVTGVRLRRRTGSSDDDILEASLVIDATGRGSRSPRWLAELDQPMPDEERMHVGVHYSTRLFRRQPADLGGCRHVLVAIPPGGRHGGLALAVEGNRWVVTLVGFLGERPPTDLDEFVEYARTLWREDLYELTAGAEPLGDASTGAFPAFQRRRYDRLRRFPGRYVVTGDALCSLSPVYAQGMSVAIREAQVLGEVLDRSGLYRVGPRFFRRTRPVVDTAWKLATGADLGDPEVEGRRTVGWRLVNAYMNRLLPVAHRDPLVADAFLRVNAMVGPPQHLMSVRIASRVLRGRRARGDEAERPPVASRSRSAGVRPRQSHESTCRPG